VSDCVKNRSQTSDLDFGLGLRTWDFDPLQSSHAAPRTQPPSRPPGRARYAPPSATLLCRQLLRSERRRAGSSVTGPVAGNTPAAPSLPPTRHIDSIKEAVPTRLLSCCGLCAGRSPVTPLEHTAFVRTLASQPGSLWIYEPSVGARGERGSGW
jgi:hypothetical protein